MRSFFKVLVVGCVAGFLIFAAGSADAGSFKIGGGMFFDNNIPGAHLSVDIPVGEGSFAISPFADFFHKSESKIYGGGLNALIKKPAGESSTFYFGAGGGLANVKVEASVPGATASASKTSAMANVVAGLEFGVSEKTSIFAQGKWIGTFGGSDATANVSVAGTTVTVPIDLQIKHFALEAGVAFSFGE
jgi:hypothetical protein